MWVLNRLAEKREGHTEFQEYCLHRHNMATASKSVLVYIRVELMVIWYVLNSRNDEWDLEEENLPKIENHLHHFVGHRFERDKDGSKTRRCGVPSLFPPLFEANTPKGL